MHLELCLNKSFMKYKAKAGIKALFITAFALILLLSVWFLSGQSYRKYLLEQKHSEVHTDLTIKGNLFTKAIERRFALIYGLEAYTKSQLSGNMDFSNRETFCEGIFIAVEGIRNILIAPDGIGRYVYPLEGNESVVGLNMLYDERPEVREDLQLAISTQKPIVSGPYELRQGGQGIIIRKAVFFQEKFWGLTTIAVDMNPIYFDAGLTEGSSKIEYSFRNKRGLFYGKDALFKSEPVIFPVEIIDKSFELAAVPIGGWEKSIQNQLLSFKIYTLLVMLLLIIIFYMGLYRNFRINELVNKKTFELDLANTQLKNLSETLDLKVKERTGQLEAANKELEAFSYSVSHDLRAPLRHMAGFIELLKKNSPEIHEEKNLHYISVISDSVVEMDQLINDLLSFFRMGRMEMLHSKVDMNALLKEVMGTFKGEMEERRIECKLDVLPEVKGDTNMLKLVLINLISNALKFTCLNKEAKIEIGWEPDRENSNCAVFFIKDNGAGFDMQYKDNLFGIFQRLHSQKDFKGTGVGLANVKRIIERHRGRVWAEGVPGEGAVFYFTLQKFKEKNN